MRTEAWLASASKQLQAAGITSARLDGLILLEDCLGRDRGYLLAHPELQLSAKQKDTLDKQLDRRLSHEPLAYIRRRSEFYGRTFYVDPRVLVPRPESETIISLLTSIAPAATPIIDVGTGSGALAITAQLELPDAKVFAIDSSADCLTVARQNATTYKAAISFEQGDLLQPLLDQKLVSTDSILLCNLPYVPTGLGINQAASYEPALALFGGSDGLDVYRRLFEQLNACAIQPLAILAESLPSQHTAVAAIAEQYGHYQKLHDGFIQLFAGRAAPCSTG